MRQATGRWVRYAAALLLLAVFLPTGTVLAACCKCQDPNNASQTICLKTTGACGNLKTLGATNPDVIGLTCQGELGEGECRLIEQGGLCGVLSEATGYSKTANSSGVIVPKLNADIGVAFTKANTAGGLVKSANIGEYISTIYKVSIGLATIAAAIMIVYGGFLYVLGGTFQSIQSGKQKIKNAIIGLILIFSSYTILNLVNPQLTGLNIISMLKGEAISDPTLAKKVTTEFARKTISEEEEAAPAERAGNVVPPPTTPEVGVTPSATAQPPATGGAIVTDPYGNLVAQGACPGEMVRIPYSEKYQQATKKNVSSFCMDRYESPNQKGIMPFEGVTEWEADLYCNAVGKRLCTDSEWTRACLGPDAANTYGYGPKYVEGKLVSAQKDMSGEVKKTSNPAAPCNYDSNAKSFVTAQFQTLQHSLDLYKPKTWADTFFNPQNTFFTTGAKAKDGVTYKDKWDAMMKAFDKLNAKEPSGTRKDCVTAEGVYDMPANVQEITLSDDGLKLTLDQRIAKGTIAGSGKPYRWRGFYWNPIAHLGNTKALPSCNATWGTDHAVGWRGFENGFRCCLSLQE